MRKFATELVNDNECGFTEGLNRAIKDGDLKSTFFTLPLTVSGKRGSAIGRVEGQAKGQHYRDDDEPVRKLLKSDIGGLKAAIIKSASNGQKGKGKNRDRGVAAIEDKSASGASSSKDPTAMTQSRLFEMRDKEVLRFKTDGANGKVICQFYQRGSCTRGGKCRFAHLCWRCHKLGHNIFECSVPPQFK